MDSKGGAAVTERSYEEFKPEIKWTLEECPVYEFTVPDFKKEHLTVKLDPQGVLKISGERPLGGNRWQQFSETIPVRKDSKISDFNAKLTNGALRIALPKTVTKLDSPQQKAQELASTTTQTNDQEGKKTSDLDDGEEKKTSDDSAHKGTKLGELMKADPTTTTSSVSKEDNGDDHKGKDKGTEEKDVNGGDHDSSRDQEDGEDGSVDDDHKCHSDVARLRRPGYLVTVILVVIAVVVIGAYTRFMSRALSGEDDHQGEL